jgi:glycosyltransferase involved in cell wall biosynthesis
MGAVTEEKGVFRALSVAKELMARGRPTEVHVAGPADDLVRSRLEREAQAAGVPLHLHGVVDAAGKGSFFAQIDVFAFPSTYRNETQGIVNLEALCAGRPIVAMGQCCVGETILPFGGVVISEPATFVRAAAAAIERWLRSEVTWACASQDARRQFEQNRNRSREQLGILCECIRV